MMLVFCFAGRGNRVKDCWKMMSAIVTECKNGEENEWEVKRACTRSVVNQSGKKIL